MLQCIKYVSYFTVYYILYCHEDIELTSYTSATSERACENNSLGLMKANTSN